MYVALGSHAEKASGNKKWAEKKERKSEWTILLRPGVPTPPPAKIPSGRFSTTFTPISTPHATGGSFLLAAFAVNGKHLAEDGNYRISAFIFSGVTRKKGQAQIGIIIARSKRDPVAQEAEFGILLR